MTISSTKEKLSSVCVSTSDVVNMEVHKQVAFLVVWKFLRRETLLEILPRALGHGQCLFRPSFCVGVVLHQCLPSLCLSG